MQRLQIESKFNEEMRNNNNEKKRIVEKITIEMANGNSNEINEP